MATLLDGEKFKVIIPAKLEKAEDGSGEWRVYGLASTPKRDQQGEIVDLKGLDLSPIEKGRGVFNFDHKKGPENTVGVIDKFKKTDEGLYLGGYLFQNHDRAKSIHQIMSSLKKSDHGRMGMSVEGIIKQRAGEDGKVIKKAVITSCAITMNPINEETYVDLAKSFAAQDVSVEFESDSLNEDVVNQETIEKADKLFSASQVLSILQKALGVGAAYATSAPAELSGGDALAQESLDSDEKPKERKKPARKSKEEFKKSLADLMDELQRLYPEASRTEIWETVKDRMNRKFLVSG